MNLSCQLNHLIICFCFCFLLFFFHLKNHWACISIDLFPGLWRSWCWNYSIDGLQYTYYYDVPVQNERTLPEDSQQFLQEKAENYFIIDFGFKNDSLIVNSLNYSSYFVSHEYYVNSRNRSNYLDSYILSKKFHGYIIDRSSP